ncbi:hypothetical protein INT47_004685 [Mucor saturninus]|uniref:Uncharacterized protein n=1 Tax=Mucor saturninus TaxID=64648 RepID=A0A8H7QK18_9FUNG|nr:hypothetical protein INT47_004685 [Mucor saturninus]
MEFYSVSNALDETVYNSQYQTSEEIKQYLKKWAIENNFVLFVAKSEKDRRLHLRCKCGKACGRSIENPEERKRTRTSIKDDCPFIIKINFSKLTQIWTVEQFFDTRLLVPKGPSIS